MRILAVDTSTLAEGVTLLEPDRVLCDIRLDVPNSHAPHLLAIIHQALAIASVPLTSVDVFAASQGPGSFTGLRIGVATLLGLGRALDRAVLGVDTLEALALKIPFAAHPVCALLDARKGEVFGAIFRPTAHGLLRLTPNLVMTPEAFCANITERTILLGTGVEVYRSVWQTRLGERAIFAPPWLSMPCSLQVAVLALARVTLGGQAPTGTLTPTYLRPSEAEITWPRGQPEDSSPI